jgi:hypothetical protein
MIVHHSESPIVAHNRARAEALRWAAAPDRWIGRAATFAGAGSGLAVPPIFRSAPQEARRAFSSVPAAAEFALGLLQRLEAGRKLGGGDALALVRGIEAEAKDEIARIALLEAAARDQAGAEALAALLAKAGLAMEAPAILPEPASGRPLAWLLSGRRQGS